MKEVLPALGIFGSSLYGQQNPSEYLFQQKERVGECDYPTIAKSPKMMKENHQWRKSKIYENILMRKQTH